MIALGYKNSNLVIQIEKDFINQTDADMYAGSIDSLVLEDGTVLTPFQSSPDPATTMATYLADLEKKRQQNIDQLKGSVAVAMLMLGWTQTNAMIEGAAFYGDHAAAIYAYVAGASPNLLTNVTNDPRTWLTDPLPTGGTIINIFEAYLNPST